MAKKTLGSVKRFGPRYGRRGKHKLAAIEKEQKKDHKCPHCNRPKVKRIATGIWQCAKCGSKFTGRAYVPSFRSPIKDIAEKELRIDEVTDILDRQKDDEELSEDEKPKKYKEASSEEIEEEQDMGLNNVPEEEKSEDDDFSEDYGSEEGSFEDSEEEPEDEDSEYDEDEDNTKKE